MKNLDQVANEAEMILAAHEEGAEMDAGFDAGEFSGPAHDRMAEQEITQLATENGFTYEEVFDEVIRRSNEPVSAALPCDSPRE